MMLKLKGQKIKTYLMIFIGVILFSVVFVKASISSFTHDESYTYLGFIQDSFMDILSFKNWYTNNHILNSLTMKYSKLMFGPSEISLRLPNLVALVIYMVFSYLLIKPIDLKINIPIFILLTTNSAVIDLFGVARGYGLSFAFMFMSIYYVSKYLQRPNHKYLIMFHLGAVLASLSNFTMLTVYVSLLIVYNLIQIIHSYVNEQEYKFIKSNGYHFLALAVSFIILFEPVRRIISYGELNFGGKSGFFEDTGTYVMIDLIQKMPLPSNLFFFVKLTLASIVLISFSIILRKSFQKDRIFFSQFNEFVISNLLLIIISVVITLLHWVLGADFPISRFATFLVPLYLIHFGFLSQYLFSLGYQRTINSVLYGLAIASIFGFILNFSWYSASEWGYDMNTKNMMEELIKYHEENHPLETHVDIGINWVFEPAANFYRDIYGLDWLNEVNRESIKKSDQYYYLFKDQLESLEEGSYVVIKEYPKTESLLLRNLEVKLN